VSNPHAIFSTFQDCSDLVLSSVPRRDEILAVRVHQSAFRKARVVLTKDILGFSAVGDPTLKHMSDHINLEEIQAAYEVEGDRDMVEIVTLEDGKNSGRIYQIHTSYDHSAEVRCTALVL
jgi:hypothetical protein